MNENQLEDYSSVEHLKYLLGCEPCDNTVPVEEPSLLDSRPEPQQDQGVIHLKVPSLEVVDKLAVYELYLLLCGWKRSKYYKRAPEQIAQKLTRDQALQYLRLLIQQSSLQRQKLKSVQEQNSSQEASSVPSRESFRLGEDYNIEQFDLLGNVLSSSQEVIRGNQQLNQNAPIQSLKSFIDPKSKLFTSLDCRGSADALLNSSSKKPRLTTHIFTGQGTRESQNKQVEEPVMQRRGSELSGITDNNIEENERNLVNTDLVQNAKGNAFPNNQKKSLLLSKKKEGRPIDGYDITKIKGKDSAKNKGFLLESLHAEENLIGGFYVLPDCKKMP